MITVNKLKMLLAEDDIVLTAGENGLHKMIEFINVQELAQKSSWMKRNGFILTTFNDFEDTSSILEQIQWYAQMEASGVGFHTAKHREIPVEIIDFANKNHFPIFKIPSDYPYYRIYERVNDYLHKESEKLKEQIDKVSESMLNAVLLEKETHHIIHMMGNFLNVPVIYLNEDLETNSMWSSQSYSRSGINNVIKEMLSKEGQLFETCKISRIYQESSFYKVGDTNLSFTIFPLRNGTGFFGYLLAAIPRKEYSFYEVVIKHGITALLLDALKKNATKQFIKNQDIQLFEQIFCGGGVRDLDLDSIHYPVTKLKQIFIAETSDISIIKDQFLRLETIIHDRAQQELMWISGNRIIGLLTFPASHKIKEAVAKELAGITVGYSDSRWEYGSSGIKKLYEQAEYTLKHANINNKAYAEWQDLKFNKFIYSLDQDHFLYNYEWEVLRPLLDYDHEKETDLVNTLYVYLNSFFSLKDSGEALYVHPNTVKYRLEKIKELLPNIELNDPEQYMNLMFALKLQNYKEKNHL